jgi:uncharacterized protein DUF748
MRLVALACALVALVLGAAGASTMLLERRLAGLMPGGLEVSALRFNPYSGRLSLTGVRGRDGAGRVVFSADAVEATADPIALLHGSLVVRKVEIRSPRAVLTTAPALELDDVAAALAGPRARPRSAPALLVEGLMVTGGSVLVEEAGEGGGALEIRDVDVRLNRFAAATPQADLAFVVDMAVYGTAVQVTGQPVRATAGDAGRYTVHVRARGLDLPAVSRDFPLADAVIERGRGDFDGDVIITGGRMLLSGQARGNDLVVRAPGVARPIRAASATVIVDRFDVGRRAGRISRVDVAGLSLALRRPPDGWSALRTRVERFAADRDIVLRRLRITDSRVTLSSDSGDLAVRNVDLALSANERGEGDAIGMSAHAVIGGQGSVTLAGVLGRDMRTLEATVSVDDLDLAPWRASLASAAGEYAGVAAFQGRVRIDAGDAEPHATMSGQATLSRVTLAPASSQRPLFRADSMTAVVRRLDWPSGEVLLDGLTFNRPTFTYGATGLAGPWPLSVATGSVVVVDGTITGDSGEQLDGVSVETEPLPQMGGATRLRLSASTEGIGRLGYERWLPGYRTPGGEVGLPLASLFAAVGEAYHPAMPVSALPRELVLP